MLVEFVRYMIAKRTLELYAGHKVGGVPSNPEVISQFPIPDSEDILTINHMIDMLEIMSDRINFLGYRINNYNCVIFIQTNDNIILREI